MNDVWLTRRQADVLAWLEEHRRRGGHPPTFDEICRGLRLRSRGSLHKHVHALIDAGLVEPIRGRRHGVRLREAAAPGEVPLAGTIVAGRPIEAVEVPESVEVPSLLRSDRPCFALRVRGDSMIGDGILDGDIVIVERREEAREGEIVVALIDGAEATLKRLRSLAGPPPANRAPARPPAPGGPSLCAGAGAGGGGGHGPDAKLPGPRESPLPVAIAGERHP